MPCCGKVIRYKRGNMAGLAKHLSHKIGGDPDFFTKCMGTEEVSGYGDDAKKAICAKAHKLAIGRWPSQDPDRKSSSKKHKMLVMRRKVTK